MKQFVLEVHSAIVKAEAFPATLLACDDRYIVNQFVLLGPMLRIVLISRDQIVHGVIILSVHITDDYQLY